MLLSVSRNVPLSFLRVIAHKCSTQFPTFGCWCLVVPGLACSQALALFAVFGMGLIVLVVVVKTHGFAMFPPNPSFRQLCCR